MLVLDELRDLVKPIAGKAMGMPIINNKMSIGPVERSERSSRSEDGVCGRVTVVLDEHSTEVRLVLDERSTDVRLVLDERSSLLREEEEGEIESSANQAQEDVRSGNGFSTQPQKE